MRDERGPVATVAVSVAIESYLNTTYRPDCDYIAGELIARNRGETEHSSIQGFLYFQLQSQAAAWGIRPFVELRVQTSTDHFRVPDLCAIARDQRFQRVLTIPPLLCVETLSREDRMVEILDRVDDYLAMGVPMVWIIDPWRRRASITDAQGATRPAADWLAVPGTAIRVSVASLWAELDEIRNAGR